MLAEQATTQAKVLAERAAVEATQMQGKLNKLASEAAAATQVAAAAVLCVCVCVCVCVRVLRRWERELRSAVIVVQAQNTHIHTCHAVRIHQ